MILRLNLGSVGRSPEASPHLPGRRRLRSEFRGTAALGYNLTDEELAIPCPSGAALAFQFSTRHLELRRPVQFHEVSRVAPCQPNDWS
jgi:hypothetical protein